MARTLYQKLWDSHIVSTRADGASLIYIDRHLLHEVSTPQSFVALQEGGRHVRHPAANLAVADHAVPTHDRDKPIADPQARDQVQRLIDNTAAFGVPYIPLNDPAQGIVHVVGPEQGFTLPGITIVCGDSHTSTHGAFGALAFGIGASECAVVMATQCLLQRKSPTMRVHVEGQLGPWVSAKDLALHLISAIGTNGGTGYAIEYTAAARTVAAGHQNRPPDQADGEWASRSGRRRGLGFRRLRRHSFPRQTGPASAVPERRVRPGLSL